MAGRIQQRAGCCGLDRNTSASVADIRRLNAIVECPGDLVRALERCAAGVHAEVQADGARGAVKYARDRTEEGK